MSNNFHELIVWLIFVSLFIESTKEKVIYLHALAIIANNIDLIKKAKANMLLLNTSQKEIDLDSTMEQILESQIPGYLFLKTISYVLDVLVIGGSLVECPKF